MSLIKIEKEEVDVELNGKIYKGHEVPRFSKNNSHSLQRLFERAKIDMKMYSIGEWESFIEDVQSFGEIVDDSQFPTVVYRYRLAGRRVYPVIDINENVVKTFLTEEMIRRNEKNQRKKR